MANVQFGPDLRRGIADLNGEGDVVGGTIVMRHGENALNVIDRLKNRLSEIRKNLPEGTELITVYDRSELIANAISTLRWKLVEEMLIVSAVILLFLWHFPSAIIPILTIPISVLLSFIPMFLLDINANLMSLSGMAISIGVLVDGAIVEVETRIKNWKNGKPLEERGIITRFDSKLFWKSARPYSFLYLSSQSLLYRCSLWSIRKEDCLNL